MNEIDFDEIPLKKDFGAFSLEEITSGASIYSIIKSIFTSSANVTWNDVFKFAYSQDLCLCVMLIGTQLYKISLSDGSATFINLADNFLDIAYLSKKGSIVLLSDKEIKYYTKAFTYSGSSPNQQKIIRLAVINENLIGISKTHINFLENTELTPIEVPEWTHLSYSQNILCLGGKSLFILDNQRNSIHPDTKFEAIKDISCSVSGNKIYILDNQNKVTILSKEDGFSKPKVYNTTGSTQVLPWKDDFYLTLNTYGTISFHDKTGTRVRSKNIKPDCVLRYLPTGFLMFDPQSVINRKTHFDIIKFDSVDPYDLYLRSCENSMWSEAAKFIEIYNFDADIYHKTFITNNELTRRSIDEHLRKIKDKEYVYNFCTTTPAMSTDIESALISEGLRVKPNDKNLLSMRERLRIFTKLPRTSFLQSEWKDFKSCDLKKLLKTWAKQGQFKDIAVVFAESKEITQKEKDEIIYSISPFFPPANYECLMPKSVEYFRDRAFEIDERIGQTDITVELLKIGAAQFKDLNNMLNSAILFDEFVVSSSCAEAARTMSFKEFMTTNDYDKLLLFVKDCANGKEAADIIKNHAMKITTSQAITELCSSILSQDPSMFKSQTEIDRIKSVATILNVFQNKQTLAEQILKSSTILLTQPNIDALESSWTLSETIKDTLNLIKYHNRIAKSETFKVMMEKSISDLILSVADKLILDPKLSLESWKEFTTLSKKIMKNKPSPEFKAAIKNATYRAMLALREWSEIEITTTKEIDMALEHVTKCLKNARSCSLKDENLSSAVQYLGMIPDDIAPPIVKQLFNKLMAYDAFSELDPTMTPSIIDTAEDPSALLLSVLSKHKNTQNIKDLYNKAQTIAKKIGKIDIMQINDFFAKLALEKGDIDFGVSLITKGTALSENTMASYLMSDKWSDKAQKSAICNQAIINCQPKNIAKFIECKEKEVINESVAINDANLLNFIINTDNADATEFAKSKLSEPIVNLISKYIICDLQNLNVYIDTIKSLEAKKLISEKEKQELLARVLKLISQSKDNKEIYNSLNTFSTFSDIPSAYSDMFARSFLSATGKVETNKSLLDISKDFQSVSTDFYLMMNLIKQLRNVKLMNQEIAYNFALSAFKMRKDALKDNAQLWSELLDEEMELKLIQETGDMSFGLASKKPSIVSSAKSMMSDDGELPMAAIDQIIERKEAHMFAGTQRFEQIVKAIRSPKQLKNVVTSLKEHGKKDEITRIAIDYFGIPLPLTQKIDDVVDLCCQLLNI